MNKPFDPRDEELTLGEERWAKDYRATAEPGPVVNRSGIEVKPLYTPRDWNGAGYLGVLGFPGEFPFTRGIYASMHRGRSWTQRQLIGLGIPEDYNARLHDLLAHGATAISLIPCNSVFRGYDADEVDSELLGTCGTVINTVEDMDRALQGIPLERISCALNDPSPFTLLAMLLAVARRRGIDWGAVSGTSNQSDCISHFVANHMFFRIALPGARRLIADHIEYATARLPRWNPLSVVGQHMQQAGATPAEAMAFTLSSALQYAEDCIARGLDADSFLPRFTFFFDISISFFEEVAKFRAARRLWARLARDRLGARDPRAWRFKFHAQTSGVDLTRQQPLNNIARVTAQAIAGIFGGLQSLHTDSFDEVLSTPTASAARIAVATQNILREEAHLTDVIDPLGGAYYVESLTDEMERRIEGLIATVDAAGGMYAAVEQGLVQRMIGDSARRFQESVETGRQTVVGVNAYRAEEDGVGAAAQAYPARERIDLQRSRLAQFKARRSQHGVDQALGELARIAQGKGNLFAGVVAAVEAGATHGEVCGRLRRELGFGRPLTLI